MTKLRLHKILCHICLESSSKSGLALGYITEVASDDEKEQVSGKCQVATITDYYAKHFAHELSNRYFVACAEKLAGTLFNSIGYQRYTLFSFNGHGCGNWRVDSSTVRTMYKLCQLPAGVR